MSIQHFGEYRDSSVDRLKAGSGPDRGPQGSVLVVEADEHLRLAMAIVFAAAGCRVTVAPDALTAMCEMQGELPEILVVDLDMPGAGGCDFLHVVSRSFPSVKVIAVGGAPGGESTPANVRADAFYEKGARPAELIDLVKAMAGLTTTGQAMRGSGRSVKANLCGDVQGHAEDEATFSAARLRMALVS